jgi:hypothetical protein
MLQSQRRSLGKAVGMRSKITLALTLFIELASPSIARGSENFPAAVQQIPGLYTLSCVPACTMCHKSSPGMFNNLLPGTFGYKLLQTAKVVARQPATVVEAIKQVANEMPPSDVDGDHTSDIDELKVDRNPSVAGPNDPVCSGIRYGCGAHVAPTRSVDSLGLLGSTAIALGLGAMVLRRRARGVDSGG